MRKYLLALAALWLGLGLPAAYAGNVGDRQPVAVAGDERIQMVVYDPNRVVLVRGAYGYVVSIEFDSDETVITASAGDTIAWQIVPYRNMVLLKPQEVNPETNLLVITDRRIYSFSLVGFKPTGANDSRLSYRIRFRYPEEEARRLARAVEAERTKVAEQQAASAAVVPRSEPGAPQRKGRSPTEWNFNYTVSGAKKATPVQMFDDGEFTYVRFADHDNIPAIFMVDSDKNETLVNYRREGQWLVIERVARQYTFRANNNADVVCIFNEGLPQAPPTTLQQRSFLKLDFNLCTDGCDWRRVPAAPLEREPSQSTQVATSRRQAW